MREFEAFTADLYRLADWLSECGVETVVMESTGVYWIPAVRGAGRAGTGGDAGGPQTHQERAGSQDRRAGLPVAAAVAHLRTAVGSLPARRGHTALAQLPAAAGHAGGVRVTAYPAHAKSADPDEREAPARDQRHHGQDGHGNHGGNRGRPTGPAATGATARSQDQGRRGDHRQVSTRPLAGGTHLRADPGPGTVPVLSG